MTDDIKNKVPNLTEDDLSMKSELFVRLLATLSCLSGNLGIRKRLLINEYCYKASC